MQKILITLIKLYQRLISPYLKTQCKFFPSCSEYAILAIRKYGVFAGFVKAITRVAKCNPLTNDKIDFP